MLVFGGLRLGVADDNDKQDVLVAGAKPHNCIVVIECNSWVVSPWTSNPIYFSGKHHTRLQVYALVF
jgi:hypothetical protein